MKQDWIKIQAWKIYSEYKMQNYPSADIWDIINEGYIRLFFSFKKYEKQKSEDSIVKSPFCIEHSIRWE